MLVTAAMPLLCVTLCGESMRPISHINLQLTNYVGAIPIILVLPSRPLTFKLSLKIQQY